MDVRAHHGLHSIISGFVTSHYNHWTFELSSLLEYPHCSCTVVYSLTVARATHDGSLDCCISLAVAVHWHVLAR